MPVISGQTSDVVTVLSIKSAEIYFNALNKSTSLLQIQLIEKTPDTENSGQKFPVNTSLKFRTHHSHCIAKYIVHIVTLSFFFLLPFVVGGVFCGGYNMLQLCKSCLSQPIKSVKPQQNWHSF